MLSFYYGFVKVNCLNIIFCEKFKSDLIEMDKNSCKIAWDWELSMVAIVIIR
jgi:hypothetical protein